MLPVRRILPLGGAGENGARAASKQGAPGRSGEPEGGFGRERAAFRHAGRGKGGVSPRLSGRGVAFPAARFFRAGRAARAVSAAQPGHVGPASARKPCGRRFFRLLRALSLT